MVREALVLGRRQQAERGPSLPPVSEQHASAWWLLRSPWSRGHCSWGGPLGSIAVELCGAPQPLSWLLTARPAGAGPGRGVGTQAVSVTAAAENEPLVPGGRSCARETRLVSELSSEAQPSSPGLKPGAQRPLPRAQGHVRLALSGWARSSPLPPRPSRLQPV